jgi:hypothetical protein
MEAAMPTRRNVLEILAGAAPIVAAGCAPSPTIDPAAAWRAPGLGEKDPRRFALAHAILAPNPHNRQPWLVDLVGSDEIVFYADTTRLLPFTDPPNRQITLGCGAFLELLDLAAREIGHRAEVSLWPQGEPQPNLDSRPIAHIKLTRDAAAARDPLFGQITKRHTNREPYDLTSPPSPTDLAQIVAAATVGPLTAGSVVDIATRTKLIDLAWKGWHLEGHTPATHMESIRLLRIGAAEIAEHRDGISLGGPLFEVLKATGMLTPKALADPDSAGAKSNDKAARQALEATPTFFWLKSADNSRATQIAAGRAYARAQLTATKLGLSFQPWSMTLQEFPEMAKLYAATQAELSATPKAPVQMFVRVGRAKAIGPAPRRGLAEHIRT